MDAILSNEIGLLRKRLEVHPRDVHLRTQSHGWTPLLFAIRQCNLAMVKLLLEKGADPNICNENGKSPIHEAVSSGDVGILKLLIERGADLGLLYKGFNPAATAERLGHVAAARLLGQGGPIKKSSNF
jgi:ankyrin repeat protein